MKRPWFSNAGIAAGDGGRSANREVFERCESQPDEKLTLSATTIAFLPAVWRSSLRWPIAVVMRVRD